MTAPRRLVTPNCKRLPEAWRPVRCATGRADPAGLQSVCEMKRSLSRLIRLLRRSALVALALGLFLGMTLWVGSRPVQALPEYATRTGEPCAACHVSAGGGGPRTLRGLLWAAPAL